MAGPVSAAVPAGVGRPGLLDGVDTRPGRAGPGGGEAPPSFSVRGGPTSIHANLDDLERGSVLLAAATDEAAALSLRAAGWGSLLGLAAGQTAAAGALAARTAELSSGLMTISAEADVLYVGVRSSAEAYRTAEELARRAFTELVGGPAFFVAAALAVGNQPIPQPLTDLAIQGAPDVIAGLLGKLSLGMGVGFRIASDVTGQMARDDGTTGPMSGPEQLWPLATFGGVATGLVQIGPVRAKDRVPPAEKWEETWTPGGTGPVTNLMDHVDRAREAEPGSFQITRVTPEGPGTPEEVWLVAIPGTQSGDFKDETGWSTNPLDMGGNAEAMALDSQHVSAALAEALRDAGAGRGDALVLTGYSQGGIHAARAAADPRINGAFDVQGLLTIGSPTGGIAVPETVESLHLEHDEDLPAGMDGTANPQSASRTTITVSGYQDGLSPDGRDVMSGHGFENYRNAAAQVESSPEAARAAPVIGHLGALTAGGGVTRTIPLERVRPGQPRHPMGAGSSSAFARSSDGPVVPDREGGGPRPSPSPGLIVP